MALRLATVHQRPQATVRLLQVTVHLLQATVHLLQATVRLPLQAMARRQESISSSRNRRLRRSSMLALRLADTLGPQSQQPALPLQLAATPLVLRLQRRQRMRRRRPVPMRPRLALHVHRLPRLQLHRPPPPQRCRRRVRRPCSATSRPMRGSSRPRTALMASRCLRSLGGNRIGGGSSPVSRAPRRNLPHREPSRRLVHIYNCA